MSSRLRPVTTAMMTAIATTSRICVRTPCFWRTKTTPAEGSLVGGRSRISSWDKFISCAIDGQQMLGVCRIWLQLLAQLQNLIIYRTRRRIEIVSPNLVEQDIACEDALGIYREEFQELEFVSGKNNRIAGTPHGHSFE